MCVRRIFIYHFGLLLLQGAETHPPARRAALRLHQVPTDLMEALLLLAGPVHRERSSSTHSPLDPCVPHSLMEEIEKTCPTFTLLMRPQPFRTRSKEPKPRLHRFQTSCNIELLVGDERPG